MSEESQVSGLPPPGWMTALKSRYESGSGHAFGLYGAISDYQEFSFKSTLELFLARVLSEDAAIVAFYDIARGLRFAEEILFALSAEKSGQSVPTAMRKQFLKIAGWNQQAQAQQNPALAALRAAQGSSGAQDDPGTDPSVVVPLLDKVLRRGERVALVIEDVDALLTPSEKSTKSLAERSNLLTISRWGHDPQVVESGNLVILTAKTLGDAHPDLRTASSRFTWLDVPLPDEATRLAWLSLALNRKETKVTLAPDLSIPAMAAATAGLSKAALEDILLTATLDPAATVTWDLVRRMKEETIRKEYQDVASFLDAPGGLEIIGGHREIKHFLNRRVVQPIRQGKRYLTPSGLMFVGPPGTGKSYMASVLAKESGFNCLQLKSQKILSKWVGDSERNLEKLFACVRALSPTFLFIDEIDQKASRGTQDSSQVMSNIFGMLLEFVADPVNRGNVVFVAATNRPEYLDPALLRAGRFEAIIPFLPPNNEDRRSVIRVALASLPETPWIVEDQDISETLIDSTDDWTQAELVKLVGKAAFLASENSETLSTEHLLKAKMLTVRRSTDYESYIEQALAVTTDLEVLPPDWRSRAEQSTVTATTPTRRQTARLE